MSMKKFTKKMLAIVAAGAMTMGLAMPVFAEGAGTTTKEAYITKVFNTEVAKDVNFTFKAEQQKNGAGVEEAPLVGVVFPDGIGNPFCRHCLGFCRQPVPSGGSFLPLAVSIPVCGCLVRQYAGPGAENIPGRFRRVHG